MLLVDDPPLAAKYLQQVKKVKRIVFLLITNMVCVYYRFRKIDK